MTSRAPGIRETVKILQCLLTDCGCPQVPSESFRLAKFDKPEAVDPFWAILHHLLSVHLILDWDQPRDLREATKDCCISSDVRQMQMCVKKRAFEVGYSRAQFYRDVVSSRELLLFFAWLLRAAAIVPRLQWYHVRAARQATSIPLHPTKRFLLEHTETQAASLHREIKGLIAVDSQEDSLRKIQWLKGMLVGNGRSVENSHRAAVRLSHTLLSSCSTERPCKSSRTHLLSLHDLFLLRYPEQLKECEGKLSWHVGCLERLENWRQHEHIFWQWMESVLDLLCNTSAAPRQGERDDDVSHSTNLELGVDELKEEVYQCQLRLSSAIGNCLDRVGASCQPTNKKEEFQSPHLSLWPVALENNVLLQDPSREPSGGHQLVMSSVEEQLRRLKDRLLEEEKVLHSLKTTIAASITH